MSGEELNLKEMLSWKARRWKSNNAALSREAMVLALRKAARRAISDELLYEVLAPLFSEGAACAS